MPDLMPSDVLPEVREVLERARRGKGEWPNFLTAFQVLARLPESLRARLIGERTGGGAGAGNTFAATSVVARAARMIPGIEIEYMDCVDLSVQIAGNAIVPSAEVCALYRLRPIAEVV